MPLELESESGSSTRREFARNAVQTLTALVLIEGLWSRRLLGDDVRPIVTDWFKELDAITRDVHEHRVKDVAFQASLEGLYRRVDLASLLKSIDFDRITAEVSLPKKGAQSLPVSFSHVAGLPGKVTFGGQVFAMSKGRSVVPHGHNNMATGFLVIKGTFRGRHYDRVEDHKDHYIIRPTIDRTFQPGEFSTISDHRDNVHWFTNLQKEPAFIFNIHVTHTDPGNTTNPGRVYVDPDGEKLSGGLIRAPKITYGKANQLYG